MSDEMWLSGQLDAALEELRRAEERLRAVEALVVRWESEAKVRGPFDVLYTNGVAAMLRSALTPATPPTEQGAVS